MDERVEIILLFGQIRTYQGTARQFNEIHPERTVSRTAVTDLVEKFQRTGSVMDDSRVGRPPVEEVIEEGVLAQISVNPQQSARAVARSHNLTRWSVQKTLKKHKFHPYKIKLVQELIEDDFDRRLQFCEIMTDRIISGQLLTFNILFTDEASFSLHGEVNRHNSRYWSQQNPHWCRESHTQNPQKINLWAGILGNQLIGPFEINGNLNRDIYLEMLQNEIVPAVNHVAATTFNPDGTATFNINHVVFQQDGAPPHYGLNVRAYLDEEFPNRWIGRRGEIEWPARSPDLNPLDFFLWGHLKSVVYATKPASLQDLRNRIQEECQRISPEMLQHVRDGFEHRLYYCMETQGEQFEHLI